MHIFITGGSGFVGSAIIKELIRAGHEVTGLARSEGASKILMEAGAKIHMGRLEDLEGLSKAVEKADGVIHTAFNHDFSNFKANCEIDRQVILSIGRALAASDRPFVITSAIGVLQKGRVTEETLLYYGPEGHLRGASEAAADLVVKMGVKASVIRLAPTVHGEKDHNFIPSLIQLAKAKGVSGYIGEGENCWPAVHRDDVASLYRLVLEKGKAGDRFHAVAEEGIPFREIALAIGKGLNMPVIRISMEKASEHFGWFANFAQLDISASSKITRGKLGWQPTGVGLIQELGMSHYFI